MSLKAALLAAKRRLKMQAGGVATDTFDPVPEEDPAAVKRGQRFLSGVGLGIPREPVRNASGDVVFPTNAIERALTQSDIAAKQYAAAFMGPGKTPGVRPRLYLTAGRDYDIPSTVLTKDLPRPEGAMEALRRPASPPQRQIDVPDPYAKPLERPAPKPMSEADWEKEWQDFAGEYGHTDEEMEAKYWELRDAQRDAERQRALDEPKYQTPPWPDMPRGRAARVREAVKRSTGRQQGGGVDEPGQDIHDLDPQEVATWERTSGPLGSNPGGMHEAPDGSQHYVKAYPGLVGHDRTLNEQLTNQLYKAAGVPVADTKVTRWRNGTALSSQIVEGKKLSRFEPSEYPKIKDLLEHYPADAWLANYDVAGTHHNNIIVDDDDRAWRIDNGGGLRYRATGKPKEHWDEDSSKELEGLQSKEHNKWTAKLFKDVRVSKDDQSYVGALRVSRVPDETIERLVNRYGPGIDKDKDQISDIIKARRDSIAKAYGVKKEKYQTGGGTDDPDEGFTDPMTGISTSSRLGQKLGEVPIEMAKGAVES